MSPVSLSDLQRTFVILDKTQLVAISETLPSAGNLDLVSSLRFA